MKTQICNTCNHRKSLAEFRSKPTKNGLCYEKKCKKCAYLHGKNRVTRLKTDNPDKYNEIIDKRKKRDSRYYHENKKNINSRNNNYYESNKEHIQRQRKNYRKNNPEKVKGWKNSYRDSIDGKLSMNYRRRVRKEIGSGSGYLELLDCSIDHLKKWFEFNFKLDEQYGMTWENYGSKWTIDHVVPCCSFDMQNEDEVKKCFGWKNTIPVGKYYNQSKNGTIKIMDIIKLELRLKLFMSKILNVQNTTNNTEKVVELQV